MKRLVLIVSIVLMAGMPAHGHAGMEAMAARKQAVAAARALGRDGFKTIEPGEAQTRLEKCFLKANSECAQVTALSNAANQYAMP